MIYKDSINEKQFLQLADERGICISIYLPTTPLTQDIQHDRIALKNLMQAALEQAALIADKRQVLAISDALQDLQEDDGFWEHQGHGLAILVTPTSLKTYRLAYPVQGAAEVSDRFYLKPLVSALKPQSAYVVAISQKSVKLYEFLPSQVLQEVLVPDLPKDFSDAVGVTLQRDRAATGRLQGDEGAKVLQTKFLRAIEKVITPLLSRSGIPLILATTSNLQHIYRSLNSYELLADQAYEGSVENIPVEDLRQAIIPLVQELHQEQIQTWVDLYQQRSQAGRTATTTDWQLLAYPATHGQISDLLVDQDAVQYGTIDENGIVELASKRSAETYDIIDEIVSRVLANGGTVVAVSKDDPVPAELLPAAAILRWV